MEECYLFLRIDHIFFDRGPGTENNDEPHSSSQNQALQHQSKEGSEDSQVEYRKNSQKNNQQKEIGWKLDHGKQESIFKNMPDFHVEGYDHAKNIKIRKGKEHCRKQKDGGNELYRHGKTAVIPDTEYQRRIDDNINNTR